MDFDFDRVSRSLPAYLSDQDKGRLQKALVDFSSYSHKESAASTSNKILSLQESQKLYSRFYLRDQPEYLLQADVIDGIRQPVWINDQTSPDFATYSKEYVRAMMISNTCDVDVTDKERYIPKDVIFVPVVPLAEFVESITADQRIRPQTAQITHNLRNQQFSNLFYLPSGKDFEEHIAILDQPFSVPGDEIATAVASVISNRVVSLSQWAYYLFTMKLSFHLCRLPEGEDRKPLG